MTLKEIAKSWLKTNGYDGLFSIDGNCGCEVDNLMPCGAPDPDCEPGYKIDSDDDYDFLIVSEKE